MILTSNNRERIIMRYNINNDGKAYSVSTASKPGGYRRPRLSDGRIHPCLITRADGTQSVIIGTSKKRTTSKKFTPRIVDIPHRMTAADLPALLAD
jgi:hypothetical protein